MTAVRMGNPNVIQVRFLSRKVNYNLLVLIRLQAYDFYCAALINYNTQILRVLRDVWFSGWMCDNVESCSTTATVKPKTPHA